MTLRKETIKNLTLTVNNGTLDVSSEHTVFCSVHTPLHSDILTSPEQLLEDVRTVKRLCLENGVKLKGYTKCKAFILGNKREHKEAYEKYVAQYKKLRDLWLLILESQDEKYYDYVTELRYSLEEMTYRDQILSKYASIKYNVKDNLKELNEVKDERYQLVSINIG